MASETPFLLVGEDRKFVTSLKVALERLVELPVAEHTIEEMRACLDGQSDATLVLAASKPEEADELRMFVQEIRLQRWPLALILVESTEVALRDSLAVLEPYVAARLTWPGESSLLSDLVHRYRPCSNPDARESLGEKQLRRQLLAQTPSLLPLLERVALAARHEVPVLLTGETGTGKSFLAKLIHEHSARAKHRFLTVACGAISANLVESEFFGHVRGAFTGADRDQPGKFAAAGQGTILLDEIDTLGLAQQASLLRVVETGEYEPVGSTQTLKTAARLLVASNWNLEEAVEAGRFRKDLYYRLNVLAFQLPPLRERVQDIAPLARALTARFARKFHKDLFEIAPETLAVLESCPWPGNIRQLENVVQQAVLASSGTVLLPSHLPPGLSPILPLPISRPAATPSRESLLSRSREAAERNLIERALVGANYSRTKAARQLGISRVMLYKKIKKYGLLGEEREGRG